jgi:RND family efflux transporter MFP subunit
MGQGGIMLSKEKQQLMGVRIGEVVRKPLIKVIRTVGAVEADETRIAHIHTKIRGWIEELSVDFTGQLVEKGQLLFTLYSPELVATQEEYLLALRAQDYLGDSPFKEISSGSRSVLEATRRRLKLWDITDEQIKELEQTGKPKINLEFYSFINGYVTEKHALAGMAVTPGMALYTITDLSKVWVLADIYEQELSLVRLAQEARVTIASYPGEVFTGKVIYIYPYMESATRTVKIRLELDNTEAKLKPKMFANVLIKVNLGQQLTVPDGAILDSGSRQIAFVSLGKGHFEPRDVTLGPKVDDHYVILQGLKEGEKVVTSATFLIDSESQLKSAVGGMAGHQH